MLNIYSRLTLGLKLVTFKSKVILESNSRWKVLKGSEGKLEVSAGLRAAYDAILLSEAASVLARLLFMICLVLPTPR